MSLIRADILQPVDVAGAVQQGFERGRQQRAQIETQRAIQALSGNPADADALRRLYQYNPQLGMQMEDALHQRAERAREADFRSAISEVVLGGGQPGAMPQASVSPGAPAGEVTGQSPAMAPAPGADAYSRAVRANPFEALRVQNQKMELTKGQFNILRGLNEASLQLLGGVKDQASYDAAKQRAVAMYGRFGLDLSSLNLPEEYSPEAIDGLMRAAMKTRDQFEVMIKENRLDWDIADDQADNERADLNQQSLDAYRRGQLSNARRGQDITDRRGRRGQDMTDQRVRDSASFRGEGRKGGKRSDLVGPVHTDGNGRRIQYSKAKGGYVDLATGEVVR